MRELEVPGVAVGVLEDGVERVVGFGVTSAAHPLPVHEHTLFQIGSITKTVTATAMMRLVERGEVELDAPVRTYLPGLRLADEEVARRVTVRHLFLHTGGWVGDVFEDTGDGDDALAIYVDHLERHPQVTPLGEVWSYNNSAFGIAGRVLEVVTGTTFERAAHDLVLGPLGMDRSHFFPKHVMLERFAVGHVVRDDGPEIQRPWSIPRSANAAGGLASTVSDLLRYARFHLGDGRTDDGTRLLSEASLRAMQTPMADGSLGTGMGLAWHLRDVDGCAVVGHGGSTLGQIASLWMVPERGFAFVALTNADRGTSLLARLERWVQENLLGLAPQQPELLPMRDEELAPYAGRYVVAGTGDAFAVSVADGALRFEHEPGDFSGFSHTRPEPRPPFRAGFFEPDRLLVLEGPAEGERMEFLRGADGAVVWLRAGRVYARQA